MLDDTFRALKARLWRPLVGRMGWLHPNAMSVLAFAIGLGCAWAAAQGWHAAGLGLWWLNRAADGLDGELARASGRNSDFGGYLDMLLDVATYVLVPAGLAFSAGAGYAALALLLGCYYLNLASWLYLSAVLEKRGVASRGQTSIVMPAGLVAGTETVVFYSAFFLVPQWLSAGFVLMAALVFITVIQRLWWARRHLQS